MTELEWVGFFLAVVKDFMPDVEVSYEAPRTEGDAWLLHFKENEVHVVAEYQPLGHAILGSDPVRRGPERVLVSDITPEETSILSGMTALVLAIARSYNKAFAENPSGTI